MTGPETRDNGLRPARHTDIAAIQALLDNYAARGNLLPRNAQEIADHLDEFLVWQETDRVIACGALEILAPDLGEIRSLAVADSHLRSGIGRRIARCLIDRAVSRKLGRVMALTYVPGFFESLGFRRTSRDALPEKVWQVCVNCYKFAQCDEIAVILPLPAPGEA